MGASLLEVDYLETCRSLLATAEARGKRILVPVDILALSPGGTFGPGQDRAVMSVTKVPTYLLDGWASTSATRRPGCSQPRSPPPAACSGTARWACSRTRGLRGGY